MRKKDMRKKSVAIVKGNCLCGKCDLRTRRGREECVNAVWDRALDVIRSTRRASVAHFQRQLCIRYTVAVSLVDELEKRGIVGPHRLGGREILIETENNRERCTSARPFRIKKEEKQ